MLQKAMWWTPLFVEFSCGCSPAGERESLYNTRACEAYTYTACKSTKIMVAEINGP